MTEKKNEKRHLITMSLFFAFARIVKYSSFQLRTDKYNQIPENKGKRFSISPFTHTDQQKNAY